MALIHSNTVVSFSITVYDWCILKFEQVFKI